MLQIVCYGFNRGEKARRPALDEKKSMKNVKAFRNLTYRSLKSLQRTLKAMRIE